MYISPPRGYCLFIEFDYWHSKHLEITTSDGINQEDSEIFYPIPLPLVLMLLCWKKKLKIYHLIYIPVHL